jgi:hypothetical protein
MRGRSICCPSWYYQMRGGYLLPLVVLPDEEEHGLSSHRSRASGRHNQWDPSRQCRMNFIRLKFIHERSFSHRQFAATGGYYGQQTIRQTVTGGHKWSQEAFRNDCLIMTGSRRCCLRWLLHRNLGEEGAERPRDVSLQQLCATTSQWWS